MLNKSLRFLKPKIKICGNSGQGLTEYALILLLVSIVSILAMTPLGNQILVFFQKIAAAMVAAIT